ncbi:hypothetical protein VTI28DRAFT_4680 [Corynascus sepedonium]
MGVTVRAQNGAADGVLPTSHILLLHQYTTLCSLFFFSFFPAIYQSGEGQNQGILQPAPSHTPRPNFTRPQHGVQSRTARGSNCRKQVNVGELWSHIRPLKTCKARGVMISIPCSD